MTKKTISYWKIVKKGSNSNKEKSPSVEGIKFLRKRQKVIDKMIKKKGRVEKIYRIVFDEGRRARCVVTSSKKELNEEVSKVKNRGGKLTCLQVRIGDRYDGSCHYNEWKTIKIWDEFHVY